MARPPRFSSLSLPLPLPGRRISPTTRPAILFLLCFLAAQAVAAPPATVTGNVVSVHHGDTVTVRTDDGKRSR
jgi:hypothetical protein